MQGKYSPTLTKKHLTHQYIYNCRGEIPTSYTFGIDTWDEQSMFGFYDHEGFDMYGYSSFDENGNYVGCGNGIDRDGYTEFDYQLMSNDEYVE